jgi:sorting nexin-8
VWRKQASISVQEEFVGKPLPPTLEDSLPANLQELFDRVRTGVRRSAEQYINMCTYVERLAKRHEGLGAESARISAALRTLTDVATDTYAADPADMAPLSAGVAAASKHYGQAQALLDDEARAWDEGALEDLKRQRDAMVSVREMFERRDRYDRDNIPALERRIKANEEKLVATRAKPDVKPGEAEKLEDAIMRVSSVIDDRERLLTRAQDKKSIVDQHARGVFVKECIRDEIQYFQSTQFQVSRLHQDWAAERVKYSELQADNWRQLADQVEGMPLGE